jgi:hypothetical protein
MRIKDIIKDQYIKDKINEHINDLVDHDDHCNSTRFEYPLNSGYEWKLICDCKDDNEVIIRIKRRR